MNDYPKVDYPTISEGVVYGDKLRIESLDGSSDIITPRDLTRTDILPIDGLSFDTQLQRFDLTNCGPFVWDGKLFSVTHLQKFSSRGFLKVAPDCLHRWWFWRPQKFSFNLHTGAYNWQPGTERGFYYRKSRVLFRTSCWRWDVAGTEVDGALRHWIRSGGYAGGHWD